MKGNWSFVFGMALIVLLCVGLVACVLKANRDHEQGIHAGIVTGKQHWPAWTQMLWMADGKGGGYFIPIMHPESWTIDIGDGEMANRFTVRESEWQQVDLRDMVQFEGEEIIYHAKGHAEAAK